MSDPKFVRASYDVPTRSVQFETDDGRVLVRSGGSLCWRTNNCGNMSSPVNEKTHKPAPQKTKNWIGFAEVNNPQQHFFFIFPSYEEGREQLKASLQRKYATSSLADTIDKYADKKDPTNNPARYLAFIKDKTGLEGGTVINTLSPGQLETLMDAIEAMEGYHAQKDTRKEQWLSVSRFSASDGAAPIAGAQVHVEYSGSTFPVHADSHGQLPALPHPAAGTPPTKVKVYNPDGSWKTLLELTHTTPPRTGVLVPDMLVMAAQTLGHTAPKDAKTSKIPVHYRVQPGDSLDQIATKFRTTAADIQKLNHLNGKLIHPEQMLWIHGVGTEVKRSDAQAAAKKSAQAAIKASASKAKAAQAEKSQSTAADKPKPAAAGATPKEHPSFLEQLATWVSPTPVQYARSKEGQGAPLALFDPGDKRAPWMKVVVDEAKKFHGQVEDEIEKTTNFHKEVKDGLTTLVGNRNPWCAAFANWCLNKAGYPTDIGTEWVGRANAFVQHTVNTVDPKAPYNPLFTIIDEPIYGAIAVLGKNKMRGHHVGFVYGINGTDVILLGGNQGDRIKCPQFSKKELWFLVPATYQVQAKKDMQETKLRNISAVDGNKELGINVPKSNNKKESVR